MAATKTDNDYLADKVALRLSCIKKDSKKINVLDAFGGRGVVWGEIARYVDVNRVAIDKRTDIDDFHLHGDNEKILKTVGVNGFDYIDLDAYGIPVDQIKILTDKGFRGIVFATVIQSGMGSMPKSMITDVGLPESITRTAPTLVSRRGWEYFKTWLYGVGVTMIRERSKGRKHYIAFRLNGAELPGVDSCIPLGGTSVNLS